MFALLATALGPLSFLRADPVRILCVGDSLTDANPGYRSFLHGMLADAGADFVFVGPKQQKAADGTPLDHAGYGGYTIGPGASVADDWSGGKGNIDAVLDQALTVSPDIVLLLIGTNDFFNIGDRQPGYDPNRDGPERVVGLVRRIGAALPDAHVFVGSVIPVEWDSSFAAAFNRALAEKLADPGANVTFVDVAKLSGFQKGDWLEDKLHPSESGHRKLARAWFDAVHPHIKATTP